MTVRVKWTHRTLFDILSLIKFWHCYHMLPLRLCTFHDHLQSSTSMYEITMDCRRGYSSPLEEFFLLHSPHRLRLLVFFHHYFSATSTMFLFLLPVFPWVTRQHAISYHMEKIMICIAFHMAKIWSKRINLMLLMLDLYLACSVLLLH